MGDYVISGLQTKPLLAARRANQLSATTSLDLNLSSIDLPLTAEGVELPSGHTLSWDEIKRIAKRDDTCFVIHENGAEPIMRFGIGAARSYTLRATTGAPTLLIAGFPMHRIKGTTPDRDAQTKLRVIGSLHGKALDTTTGLGYSAIAAVRQSPGVDVTTIEREPVVLQICRLNPWSADLFDNPRIRQMIGDSSDLICGFADGEFNAVLHDPPTFSLAGELYSGAFYSQAFRILRRGGKFFHYIGDLESRSGAMIAKGAAERIRAAGFRTVERRPDAFALLAVK